MSFLNYQSWIIRGTGANDCFYHKATPYFSKFLDESIEWVGATLVIKNFFLVVMQKFCHNFSTLLGPRWDELKKENLLSSEVLYPLWNRSESTGVLKLYRTAKVSSVRFYCSGFWDIFFWSVNHNQPKSTGQKVPSVVRNKYLKMKINESTQFEHKKYLKNNFRFSLFETWP